MMNGTAVMPAGEKAGSEDVVVQKRIDAGSQTQHSAGSSGTTTGSLLEASLAAQRRVDAFLAEEPASLTPMLRAVQAQVRISLGVIDQALEQYGIPELSLSYNGGKDCLVLLYLLLASLPRRFTPTANGSSGSDPSTAATTPNHATSTMPNHHNPTASGDDSAASTGAGLFPESFPAVYVVSRHPFAEVDAFVDTSGALYHLDVERVCMGMKQALHAYLAKRPRVRAVFVGTRRTDPHGENLTHFDETDPGWPSFMRVHPVIDWHYAEIWAFIRHLGIPYCELYDRGYTSLGGTTDTSPNPALKRDVKDNGTSKVTFRPAYELMEDMEERLGRDG